MPKMTAKTIDQMIKKLEEAEVAASYDPERAHSIVDEVLYAYAPKYVQDRVDEIKAAASWWSGA